MTLYAIARKIVDIMGVLKENVGKFVVLGKSTYNVQFCQAFISELII